MSALQTQSVQNLPLITWQNIPVITTETLSSVYEVDVKNIHDNFKNNTARFVEGQQYFKLTGSDLKGFSLQPENIGLQISSKTRQLILWTERGTVRHAKMLGTDKAWDVQDQLEQFYFAKKAEATSTPEPKTKLAYTGCLTLEQQDTIKQIVKDLIEPLPKDQQGAAAQKLWGSIKSKYSVSYKFVPAEHYPAVISLIARLPLNTDLPPPPTSTAPDTTVLLELRNGQIINSKTLPPGCQIYDPRDPTSAKNMILNHTPAQQLAGLIDIMLKRVQAIAHSH